jgi:MFS family permease
MTRAWVIWAVGLLAYTVGVMQRTTFGASGIAAADRFDVAPDLLASFVFLQVGVYLAMQIPAGLLLDRWGSRALITAGSVTMASGQGLLAAASSLEMVYLGRFVVGVGDSLVFVSVMALLPRWFSARRVPVMTQVTATTGQLGQILSAVPFLAMLDLLGWTPAYSTAAAVGLFVGMLALALIRNTATGEATPVPSLTPREIRQALARVWRQPGTRLGYFSHMGTQFSGTVFVLMWGVPYLVEAQQLGRAETSALMSLFVVATIVLAPFMGLFATRHPLRRSWLVLSVIATTALMWTVVLSLSGPAPLWVLAVLVVVLGAGAPGSVLGFDFARTFNPRQSLGLAQSLVNLGGFTATLVVLQLVGWAMAAAGGYTFEAFRVAWLVQYPVWLLATLGIIVERKRARALLASQGVVPRRVRDVWFGPR